MKKLIVLLFLALFLQGCAHAPVIAITSARYANHYPSTETKDIGIFHSEPTQPYEKIGEIYVNASFKANWNYIYDQIKKEAASMGADAVIITDDSSSKDTMRFGKSKIINPIAIKFKKEQVKQ